MSSCTVRDFHLDLRACLSVPCSSAPDQIIRDLQSARDAMRRKSISLRPKSTRISLKARSHNRFRSPPSTTSTSSIITPLQRPFSTLRTPKSTRTRVDNTNKLCPLYPTLTARTTTTWVTLPMVTSTGQTHPVGAMGTSPGFRRAKRPGGLLQTQLALIVSPGSSKGLSRRNLWYASSPANLLHPIKIFFHST